MTDPAASNFARFGGEIDEDYFDTHEFHTDIPASGGNRIIPAVWSHETPHGLPEDLHYQVEHTAWDTIPPLFLGEEQILRDLIRMTLVGGIANHHPAVAQVVFQSLQPYPELAHAYLQS